MLTLPASWSERIEQSSAAPIALVEIDTGKRIVFTVEDYTAGGSETATLTYDSTDYTITDGVDFTAGTSNEATAVLMADAFLDVLPEGVNVYPLGDKVYAIVGSSDSIAGSSSSANAWSVSIATWTHKFVSGPEAFGDYDAQVVDFQPKGIEIDPISRGIATAGERELVFSDSGTGSPIRTLLTEYPDLRGKVVRAWIGFPDIVEADFVPDGVYVIQEMARAPGEVTLRLVDLGARLDGKKVTVDVINRHPLEAVEAILVAAGVPAALYDATSLDPTQYSEIGHWCVSRHKYGRGWNGVDSKQTWIETTSRHGPGKRASRGGKPIQTGYYERQDFGAIVEPVDAMDLLNDLLQLLDGILAPNEDGEWAFQRYDSGAAAVVDLTPDDYTDLDEPEKWSALYNHVEVKGPHNLDGNAILYEVEDRFSQHRHTMAGGAGDKRTLTIKSDWLTGIAFLHGALASGSGAGSTFEVSHAQANGFSGLRASADPVPGGTPPTFAQSSNTTCTSSRLVYLLLFHTTDGRREIVSCDAATMLSPTKTEDTGTWAFAQYTVAARGLFGTTAQSWDASNGPSANPNFEPGVVETGRILIADITKEVDVANRKMAQLSNGLPLVPMKLAPKHFGLQVGDMFTLEAEDYVDLGQDGIDNASVWQVIRKEPQLLGQAPGIYIRAALVAYDLYKPLKPYYPPIVVIVTGTPLTNGKSLQLDGVDDYIDFGDVKTLEGADSVIFSGWIRVLGSLHTGEIWSRDDSGAEQFRLQVESAELSLEIGAGTSKTTTTSSPITLNTWHHFAVIYDGTTAQVTIRVDGAGTTTSTTGTVPSTFPTPASPSNLRLGAQSDVPDASYLGARLDELVIAARNGSPFTTAHADELYDGGAFTTPTDLPSMSSPDHWWRFEGDIDDAVGGLLGTPYGVPFFSTDTPN